MSKKIVILGAGYAGVEAALTLHKKKKKADDIEVTIIDKNSYHTLLTELHEVAGNRISEDGVIVPLRDIFKYTDVKIVKDEIDKIDFEGGKLLSEATEYKYDYLVVAAGSEPNYYGIPGMSEYCFPLWSFNDAVKIREHIKHSFAMASQEKDSAARKALLTFVVGGGGFTGIEMIGELGLWVKSLCREYDIPRNDVRLVLIEALPTILSNLKPKSIAKAANYLSKNLKVEVMTSCAITKLNPDSVELKNGTVIPTKTLIWSAGIRASCLTNEINDAMKSKACRIKVNEFTQTKYDNVYAIGDISAFVSKDGTLPALVEGAIQTGAAAAKNILADIRGKEKQKLEPKLHGVMVSIGSYFAVTDLMGYELPRYLGMFMKYLVNVHYLFGIGGFELVIKYIKHEFLHKKQDKFIVARHYSVVTPNFWLVPIRLFLGYVWLMEGIGKIKEGWLAKPVLAGLPAADTGTSASVTETGEKVFRIITESTPGWYAWIANHLVLPNALVFQIMIVLAELALGLCFISGTFTFIAGLASLGLIVNFFLSTGFYDYNWWYIPAALCMLGGAGRAFGVDHYLMPYLMRQWRYFVRNRKVKIWLDMSAKLKVFSIIIVVVIAALVAGFIYNELAYYSSAAYLETIKPVKTEVKKTDAKTDGNTNAVDLSKVTAKDGTYKAAFSNFDARGWKGQIELTIKDNKITAVNFDYVNKDGVLKSKDAGYNAAMLKAVKTNPAEFSVKLPQDLLNKQKVDAVDTITGATMATKDFKQLAAAALANAVKGDTSTAIIGSAGETAAPAASTSSKEGEQPASNAETSAPANTVTATPANNDAAAPAKTDTAAPAKPAATQAPPKTNTAAPAKPAATQAPAKTQPAAPAKTQPAAPAQTQPAAPANTNPDTTTSASQ